MTRLTHACRAVLMTLSVWCVASVCQPQPPALRISRLVLDTPARFEATPAHAALRPQLTQRLQADRRVQLYPAPSDDAPAYHLHVILQDASREVWRLSLELRQPTQGTRLTASSMLPAAPQLAPLLAAYDASWQTLQGMRQVAAASDAALLTQLQNVTSTPRPRGWADATTAQLEAFVVQQVGVRQLRAAVPVLCSALAQLHGAMESDTPLPTPQLLAQLLPPVQALVAIGDPQAVPPLIALTAHQAADVVLPLLYAIGALGGRTAQAYLLTMASGHPDATLRAGAAQALKNSAT